jgi:hypothetical protein
VPIQVRFNVVRNSENHDLIPYIKLTEPFRTMVHKTEINNIFRIFGKNMEVAYLKLEKNWRQEVFHRSSSVMG